MIKCEPLCGKQYAENPHARFDVEEVALATRPRRCFLLYRITLNLFATFAIFAVAGCCTIMEKGTYDIPLDSSVPGTNVKVYAGLVDHKGNVKRGSGQLIASVKTPSTVKVSSQVSDVYTFSFDKEGYMPKTQYRVADVSKYIYGNIIFLIGCPIGLMVDSQTGANRPFSEAPVHVQMIKKHQKSGRKGAY